MRMQTTRNGNPVRMVQDTLDEMERAHTRAMRVLADQLTEAWRGEIVDAGLGLRLSRTVRGAAYPAGGQTSLNPAAIVYVRRNAADIVSSHDEGALIRSASGLFLAIPLPSAGKGRYGRKMTPHKWEQRTGIALRYVHRRGRPALLVADDARIRRGGRAVRKGGRRRKSDGILSGAQTVPIFVLMPQVKLRKRTDLLGAARAVSAGLPGLIEFRGT